MRIVAALGGNALLKRGEALTAQNQRRNIQRAAMALAPVARGNDIVISHGNGPQVGLLALQGAAYNPGEAYPLDVLSSETQGMIGYMIEQELGNLLPVERPFASLLTMIEVDPDDPAFNNPTKFIGPVYSEEEARRLAEARGWVVKPDGDRFRRVVPSPAPRRIFELNVIDLLLRHHVVVICTGGGGIPTVFRKDGSLAGVEAVIDKDLASEFLARKLGADRLIMLTDAPAVCVDWQKPTQKEIRRAAPAHLAPYEFPAGSMGPKVEAACRFAGETGNPAAIGRLEDAGRLIRGETGTVIDPQCKSIVWGKPS